MEAQKNAKKQNRVSKLLKAPIKFLTKARDLYINSMSLYSDRVGYGTVMGCPTGHVVNNLPRSFSVNSAKSSNYDDDYRELLRAASARGLSNRVNLDVLQRQQSSRNCKGNNISGNNNNNNMPRSFSVGIGRIDEDKPCDFGEVKVKAEVFPRSRSYAVANRRTGGTF